MCDQPSKLEIEKKSLYHNSVPYLTEPETNSTKKQQSPLSVKCEAPRGEEELYIDICCQVPKTVLYTNIED